NGYGLDHRPFHCGNAWRYDQRGKRSRPWGAFLLPPAGGVRRHKKPGGMNSSGESDAKEVCLVDDDLSVLRSMQYLLASDGIKVRASNEPEEFLAHAATHRVPVVVTDIWMDGITGLEILARTCAITPRPRVIVITAREDSAARR